MNDNTIKFVVPEDSSEEMKTILTAVYGALSEKGYNPINQIVGYLLSEDPTYITNYNNARSLICKIVTSCFRSWSSIICFHNEKRYPGSLMLPGLLSQKGRAARHVLFKIIAA